MLVCGLYLVLNCGVWYCPLSSWCITKFTEKTCNERCKRQQPKKRDAHHHPISPKVHDFPSTLQFISQSWFPSHSHRKLPRLVSHHPSHVLGRFRYAVSLRNSPRKDPQGFVCLPKFQCLGISRDRFQNCERLGIGNLAELRDLHIILFTCCFKQKLPVLDNLLIIQICESWVCQLWFVPGSYHPFGSWLVNKTPSCS